MILVALGTQDKDFNRLLKVIDKAIINGDITEKVVVQAGHTKYTSTNMEIFDFMPINKFKRLLKDCNLLITHGGVGTIIDGLKANKVVIAAPRLSKYREHTNDHQLEIVNEFANKGYIIPLKDFNSLPKIIKKAKTFTPKEYKSNNSNFINMIESMIV